MIFQLIHRFFLTITLSLLPLTVFGETLGGEMVCTIKDEVIKEMDDGKALSYSSYKDDLTVGNKFILSYSINSRGAFTIETKVPNPYSNFKHSFDIQLLSDDTTIVANKEYNYTKALYDAVPNMFVYLNAHIRKNQFNIGYVGNSILSMRRYYKSDWMGVFTMNTALTNSPIIAHTYSFNCIHSNDDKWSEVFERVMNTALSRKK